MYQYSNKQALRKLYWKNRGNFLYIFFSFFSGILRELRIDSIQNKFESEVLAAQQNLEVGFHLADSSS